ncbi:MAG: metallophosphoesterase [Acidobacteria bacterium]|nr:metallophosphoesterase [Acidobacteriota bacterium]
MTEYTIRIFHISDFHQKPSDDWRRRRVLGKEWEDNLSKIVADGKPVDLVCFTGDLAFSGQPAEYEKASEFLDLTLTRLKVPPERFFVVPGNHDVDRTVQKPVWEKLRSDFFQASAVNLSNWVAGGKPPFGFEAAQLAAILERQQAYREWLRAFGRTALLPDAQLHSNLGYRQTLRLNGFPFDLHIIGLDSAWLAGDNNDSGKLRLTEDQVMRLATEKGASLPGFRIGLIHHPLEDLADGNDCRRFVSENLDLLLRGHLHETEVSEWADPQRSLRHLAAGCLYEHDKYPNCCQVIDITFDQTGRPLKFDLWFRGWAKGGFWSDTNEIYKNTNNGRLRWWVVPPPPEPDIELRERVFIGRITELETLEKALLPATGNPQPVAICAVHGMPGVGKSYLADEFAQRHHDRFPGGYKRLVLQSDDVRTAEQLRDTLLDQLQVSYGGADPWKLLRERLFNFLTLLHIENVDSSAIASVVGQLVSQLSSVPIIITGRLQGLGRQNSKWEQVSIQPFTEEDALKQLLAEFGKYPLPPLVDQKRLVKELGFLPLAIHLAVGYLLDGYSVKWFLDELHRKQLDLGPADPTDPADRARTILRSTFELSLELLRRHFDHDGDRMCSALALLGYLPVAGFGPGIGAAVAGLEEHDFETLIVTAQKFSLVETVPKTVRPDPAWNIHPLLAEYFRSLADAKTALDRMTDWFTVRFPKAAENTDEAHQQQGDCWRAIHIEQAALVNWLEIVQTANLSEPELNHIEQAASWFASIVGPFHAWIQFCRAGLSVCQDDLSKSNFYWTLCLVALKAGEPKTAWDAAEAKHTLDQKRGADREVALAAGVKADILAARGELD